MQKSLIVLGLILMLGCWTAAAYGLATDGALSSQYDAACTPPIFPVHGSPMVNCTNLSAQVGEASAVAVVGGAVGFVGVAIVLVGLGRGPET